MAGEKHPKQEVQKYLGRYDQAVAKIKRMRISGEEKQAMLTKLARLEGLLQVGDLPLPAKSYFCLVVDPPWYYDLRKDDETHRNRINYPPMQTEEIVALPIPALGDCSGSVLWLWTTNNHMPDAYRCLEHWGYEHKTILTWEKVSKAGNPHIGTGHWLRNNTEHCLLAVKGKVASFLSQGLLTNQSTTLRARRREHSRKPADFYELVEQLCPSPKLELFARESRPGWETWGNQVNLFDCVPTVST